MSLHACAHITSRIITERSYRACKHTRTCKAVFGHSCWGVCTVDLRCLKGWVLTVSAKDLLSPAADVSNAAGSGAPHPHLTSWGGRILIDDQSCISSLHTKRETGRGESISASEQRAKLTICSSVSTSSSRCFNPSGGCLCGMHFVFSQQQLHLHSDFDTFSATSALFLICHAGFVSVIL